MDFIIHPSFFFFNYSTQLQERKCFFVFFASVSIGEQMAGNVAITTAGLREVCQEFKSLLE